ncbi:siderophore synthetase component [Kushneria sinocarnis]|uniref:Siderophore synthetase component n=1 Tax=Kushneria sinocarnis TaxID=595502 RepID=A0A420WU32_9GAMM|nr:IucA/IucC family protein [Kushneria sinocarnis]RKQ96947.1 siderophore synthetase component [Kushneria sinocarnis]
MALAPDPDLLAATSFFNALLRETADWQFLPATTGSGGVVRLPLTAGEQLCVTLRHRSRNGRCRLALPLQVAAADGALREISFTGAIRRLMSESPLFEEVDETLRRSFIERVQESHHNIADSLARRDDLAELGQGPLNFLQAEQGLLTGHDFHPAPKSRAPFTTRQAQAYCPEYRATFHLVWWAVAPELAVSDSSRDDTAAALMATLLPASLAAEVPAGFVALPMHPWQAEQMMQRDAIRARVAAGRLIRLGESGQRWAPTSSHRSLYVPGAQWQLKGSLSARLTNSVRELHEGEVARGLRLDRWWRALPETLTAHFELMQEPAWLGWYDEQGRVDEASLMLLRENGIIDPAAERSVLATLTQRLDGEGTTLLAARVQHYARVTGMAPDGAALDWFRAFCERVLTPLLRLVVEEGIVLLAHQQNIVLRLDDGLPVATDYRDCQGSGVTARFFERRPGAEVSHDHRISTAMLRRYFPYYVLINSTMAVTGALAEDGLIDEHRLLASLRHHLEHLSATLEGDHALLEHLLHSPTLEVKGNFFCYLAGINESTLDDPARIYIDIPNPLLETAA